MILRDYQKSIAADAAILLNTFNIAYLSMQVRCGKTLTALHTAEIYGAKSILFLTKKKAIGSIESDYANLAPAFKLYVTNYEQTGNISNAIFDLVILDEAHCLGQYPVAAVRVKALKELCDGKPIIYLSGTPTPESYSQIYHQLYVSSFSPFDAHKNFYAWANAGFVEKKTKYVFNRQLNDYSCAIQTKIDEATKHLFITYTQAEAGFIQHVKEEVLTVRMKPSTTMLADKIKATRVFVGKNGEEIIADTEVKLMHKLHQIYSGTVIAEDGAAIAFDNSKADFINDFFKGKKIAIFYKFKAEFSHLLQMFGERITLSPELFNAVEDKIFCSQIQSGREGINLSTADALVMYNIDFSSVSYQQAKARMQAKDRTKECLLYWVFAEGGIEQKIYDRVINKQDFTLSYFKNLYKMNKDAILKQA